jgi:prepilin peptidase CpaA
VLNLTLNLSLLTIIGLGALFDIRERRIPNWIILLGITSGVILGGLQDSAHLIVAVAGFFAGILALMIPFAFGWMGAGDVKFFAAVGAFLGYKTLPRVFFYSCIVAGIIALTAMALGQARQSSFKQFLVECKYMLFLLPAGIPGSTLRESGVYSVPWGVAIGAGTIIAYYVDPLGRWAGF